MKALVCLLALLLIFTGIGLATEATEELPIRLLGERVRVVFEEKLPSGHHHLSGRAVVLDGDWLILVDSQERIYWCSISRIVYIEILRVEKGGENEDPDLRTGELSLFHQQYLSR